MRPVSQRDWPRMRHGGAAVADVGGAPPMVPLWAAIAYLSSLLPFVLGRLNTTDGLITFTVTLALLSFRSFVRARDNGEPGGGALTSFGSALALGMLAKGLIGIVLPGMVIFGARPRHRGRAAVS